MQISKLNIYSPSYIRTASNVIPFKGADSKERKNFSENPLLGYDLSTCAMPKEVLAFHLKRQEAAGRNMAGMDPIYDSFHDSLSGLRNKEYLMCRLPSICQDAIDNDDGVCVAMFDMDNFKSINQFLGYSTGDEFIKEIGSQIGNIANENDMGAYRYGGEEFVVVFKNSDVRKAKLVASKILNNIEHGALSSHLKTYKRIGTSQLQKAKSENAMISALSASYNKSVYTRELLEKYYTQTKDKDSKFARFLENERIQSNIALIKAYETIINRALAGETNKKVAEKLCVSAEKLKDINETINMYNEINSSMEMDVQRESIVNDTLTKMKNNFSKIINDKADYFASNKQLFEFLCGKYSRKAEVVQYENWLNSIENLGNFTITCGIKQYYADDLEQLRDDNGNLLPEKIVDKAGDVLKDGKAKHKGSVHVEHSI